MLKKIKPINHGLLKDIRSREEKSKDYVFGAVTPVIATDLVDNGDWTPFLPTYEKQYAGGYDTMSCVAFSCLNVIETLIKRITGYDQNLSDRFLAKASGTTQQGNSLWKVADTLRHLGACDELDYPFEGITWEEFMKPLTPELFQKALRFLIERTINYEYVYPNKDLLMLALKKSPLQVTVSFNAIKETEWGNLYLDTRTVKTYNHAVELFSYKLGRYWQIFDHYDQYIKKVDWDYQFGDAEKFTLIKKLTYNKFMRFMRLIKSNSLSTVFLTNEKAMTKQEIYSEADYIALTGKKPADWTMVESVEDTELAKYSTIGKILSFNR